MVCGYVVHVVQQCGNTDAVHLRVLAAHAIMHTVYVKCTAFKDHALTSNLLQAETITCSAVLMNAYASSGAA